MEISEICFRITGNFFQKCKEILHSKRQNSLEEELEFVVFHFHLIMKGIVHGIWF